MIGLVNIVMMEVVTGTIIYTFMVLNHVHSVVVLMKSDLSDMENAVDLDSSVREGSCQHNFNKSLKCI